MKTPKRVSREYTSPSYVGAFFFTGVLCLILGGIIIATSAKSGAEPWAGVGCLLAGGVNILYAKIADDIGRSAWQTAVNAEDLRDVLSFVNVMRSDREAELARKSASAD